MVTMAEKGTKVVVLVQVVHSITVESYYVPPPITRIVYVPNSWVYIPSW
jgi:hypothetical protein